MTSSLAFLPSAPSPTRSPPTGGILAAPPDLRPLVEHTGTVHAVSPTAGLVPLARSLMHPDVGVDLHGRGPGSQPLLLELRPRQLVAWRHPAVPGTERGSLWRAGEHEVARWCRLLVEHGIPADPSRLDLEPPHVRVPPWVKGATIVHPGAAAPSRRWPADRFAAVARAELASGRTVVVTGSPSERALAGQVAALAVDAASHAAGAAREAPCIRVLAGRTGLLGLAAVFAAAGKVVCGDTGAGHLATAVGTPSVVLFGPIPPSMWGPPPTRPQHVPLWAGKLGDPHGAEVDPGLLEISVADVLAALDRLAEVRCATPA